MSAYTPGPWVASDGGRSNYVRSVTALSTKGKVFNVAMLARPMRGDVDANAHLIASAPELLEALHVVSECGDPCKVSLYDEEGIEGWRWTHPDGREWVETGEWCEDPPLHPVARAAIAKATGEQS